MKLRLSILSRSSGSSAHAKSLRLTRRSRSWATSRCATSGEHGRRSAFQKGSVPCPRTRLRLTYTRSFLRCWVFLLTRWTRANTRRHTMLHQVRSALPRRASGSLTNIDLRLGGWSGERGASRGGNHCDEQAEEEEGEEGDEVSSPTNLRKRDGEEQLRPKPGIDFTLCHLDLFIASPPHLSGSPATRGCVSSTSSMSNTRSCTFLYVSLRILSCMNDHRVSKVSVAGLHSSVGSS